MDFISRLIGFGKKSKDSTTEKDIELDNFDGASDVKATSATNQEKNDDISGVVLYEYMLVDKDGIKQKVLSKNKINGNKKKRRKNQLKEIKDNQFKNDLEKEKLKRFLYGGNNNDNLINRFSNKENINQIGKKHYKNGSTDVRNTLYQKLQTRQKGVERTNTNQE